MRISGALAQLGLLLLGAIPLSPNDTQLPPSQTETTAKDVVHSFDIPPQSLDSALAAYTRASGTPLLYDSALTRDKRSNGVRGPMTASRALRILLEGAGVGVRFTAGGSAVIIRLARPTLRLDPLNVRATPMIGGAPDAGIMAYAQLVQEEAKAAMRRDPVLIAAKYRVAVKLWIDGNGMISRCTPASDGEPSVVIRLCDLTEDLRLTRPPPPGLPQPLRIEFRARPAVVETGT